MENKVTNSTVQDLKKEVEGDVNPTILIGIFIAVSTFFILASTRESVVVSFS